MVRLSVINRVVSASCLLKVPSMRHSTYSSLQLLGHSDNNTHRLGDVAEGAERASSRQKEGEEH